MDQPPIDIPDHPDDDERCPECGNVMTQDWEGDPDVIGGTRELSVCSKCPVVIAADQWHEDFLKEIVRSSDPELIVSVPVATLKKLAGACHAAAQWYGAGRVMNEPGAGPMAKEMIDLLGEVEDLILNAQGRQR
jgi:hypothetical protein